MNASLQHDAGTRRMHSQKRRFTRKREDEEKGREREREREREGERERERERGRDLPAMTAFVDATAGMMFLTTP